MRLPDEPGIRLALPYRPRPLWRDVIHPAIESHRFWCLVAHRRFGKTVGVVNHLIRRALRNGRADYRAAYIAPYRNQAENIAWDCLKRHTAVIPGVRAQDSRLSLELPGGAQIRLFGADNADALRGLYFDDVVFDEAADLKPGVWEAVVRPALMDRKGAAGFIGTPRGLDFFHDIYRRAVDSPDWWTAVYRADQTGVLDAGEVEAARSAMPEALFRQEMLCDFTASCDNILIPLDLACRAAQRSMSPADVRLSPRILGIDVARFGSDASCLVRRQGLQCFVPLLLKGLDNMALASRAANDILEFKPHAVFVDAGRGEGVIDRLRQLGFGVQEVHFGGRPSRPDRYPDRRSEMWDAAREWLTAGGCLPDHAALKAQLCGPTYGFDSQGRLKLESKEDLKRRGLPSPDAADALALTFAAPVAAGEAEPGPGAGAGNSATDYDIFRRQG